MWWCVVFSIKEYDTLYSWTDPSVNYCEGYYMQYSCYSNKSNTCSCANCLAYGGLYDNGFCYYKLASVTFGQSCSLICYAKRQPIRPANGHLDVAQPSVSKELDT